MNGQVVVVDDVANALATYVQVAFEARILPDTFSIALSGGSSATPCYEALSKTTIDWSMVTAIWGDERQVPLDHDDSSYRVAKEALFDRVEPLAAVHPMVGSADEYDSLVRTLLPIDLVHLGMGPDGHTASLFPGSPALDVTDRVVVETGDDLHPHPRLTLTYPALTQAQTVIFTVAGENKREMFAKIRNGEDFPAARVEAKDIIWLVDKAANG
jgi:6-phosphogluconolactonase